MSQSDLKANKGYGFKVEVIREYEKRNDREISLKSGKGKAHFHLLHVACRSSGEHMIPVFFFTCASCIFCA